MQGTDNSWVVSPPPMRPSSRAQTNDFIAQAVGMGNDQMKGSLVFMAYADASGKNVTLSPRLSYGNTEPAYTSNVTVEVLPGSIVTDSLIKVNAKCGNCRSWKGGEINPTSSATSFIFASGPGGFIKSNSKSAGVKRHTTYGSFMMDLTKATGPPQIPDPSLRNSTTGTIQTSLTSDKRDFSGPAHAALMVLTFFGLLPAGVLILRVFKSPKWHGVAQALSMALALAGVVIGILMGMKYNRVCLPPSTYMTKDQSNTLQTKNFNSPHQIIGVIVIAGLIGQFVLGFLHHRTYTKTQSPTKLAPIHVWLGRLVITLGIVNGFM